MHHILQKFGDLKITPSRQQTKTWRKDQGWYSNGKKNECEVYQRQCIEAITQKQCCKTNERICFEDFTMHSIAHPMKKNNGFEYTENFDGVQRIKQHLLYYNLKFICDKGGAQTRTLREVYHFIQIQFDFLLNNTDKNILFINILDGDESARTENHFSYLLKKDKYNSIVDKVFVGSMSEFKNWFEKDYTKKFEDT